MANGKKNNKNKRRKIPGLFLHLFAKGSPWFTKVVKNRKKYNRKTKHKNQQEDQ
jgi:hypothetical protein